MERFRLPSVILLGWLLNNIGDYFGVFNYFLGLRFHVLAFLLLAATLFLVACGVYTISKNFFLLNNRYRSNRVHFSVDPIEHFRFNRSGW